MEETEGKRTSTHSAERQTEKALKQGSSTPSSLEKSVKHFY
jgi:hypothetical protein